MHQIGPQSSGQARLLVLTRLPGATGSAGHDYDAERDIIAAMLDLFARHGISATWAVVGHLFLDRCDAGPHGPHPELERPRYAWLDEDWLAIDPCSTAAAAPHWYGPDIVDAILACPVPQEVGSHSFSHVIADDPGCPPEVLASELRAAADAATGRGVDLRSFVFPRNAVAHLDVLAAAGYRCYRGGRPSAPFAGRPAWQRRVLRYLDRAHPLAGSAVSPAREPAGVWNVPQTYLFDPTARGRHLPPALWARRPVARLRQAARHRSVFHLWFHPYNITADPERALAALGHVCREAARLRDRGRIEVLTMGDLAARLDQAPDGVRRG